MRCTTAVLHALLTNSRFMNLEWVKNSAFSGCKNSFSNRKDDCETLVLLPFNIAEEIIAPELERIVKAQKSTGGWKTNDTHRITLNYLKAFKHTNILENILGRLKFNPLKLFENANNITGYIARYQIFDKNEPTLKKSLSNQILDIQKIMGLGMIQLFQQPIS